MRMLAVSDLRTQSIDTLRRVVERAKPDLILYAGDDVVRFLIEQKAWVELALSLPYGIAGVLGNDCRPEHAAAFELPGYRNLHREPLLLDDIAILGLEGSPSDEAGAIGFTLFTQDQAQEHLARQMVMAGRRHVLLVSHTPPRGVLDVAVRFGVDSIGSSSVRAFARTPKVRGIICGHAHLQGGKVDRVGRCTVVNVASHDHALAPLRYAILDWAAPNLTVQLGEEPARIGIAALPGIRPDTAERLRRSGFRRVEDLLADEPLLLSCVSKRSAARRIRARARAAVHNVPVIIEPQNLALKNAMIVDIETKLGGDQPWLIGLKPWGAKRLTQMQELEPERRAAYLTRISAVIMRSGASRFVQWSGFDQSKLVSAFQQTGLDVPSWLDKAAWINALAWVRRAVALPVADHKLGTAARWFDYPLSAPDVHGFDCGLWYSNYLERGTPFDISKVRAHNRDDVLALEHVVRKVRALFRKGRAMVEPPFASSTKFGKVRGR